MALSSWITNLSAKEVAGWVELASLLPAGIQMKAKLDTGAKNSSINAREIEFFTRDSTEMARFKVRNKAGESIEITEPVIRQAKIKRHFAEAQQRPVVRLTVCLGGISKQVEVNLVDRAGFIYPLLIGRTYLAGDFLIDSAATFKLQPTCPVEARP